MKAAPLGTRIKPARREVICPSTQFLFTTISALFGTHNFSLSAHQPNTMTGGANPAQLDSAVRNQLRAFFCETV
jgi:hypothetical protein